MRKITCLLIAAVFCGTLSIYANGYSFGAPDYEQIERNIQDPTSSFYFPKLMARYLDGDPTMSLEESRHLYFGFVFHPAFALYDGSAEYNRLLVNTLRNPTFSEQDVADILRFTQALLKRDPFNLRALNAQLLVHAYHEDMTEYARVAWQRHIVQNAILSTGDGMTQQTPFFVIRAAHQYDVVSLLGFHFGGVDRSVRNRGIRGIFARNRHINFLSVEENIFGIRRVYFDISPTMRR